MTIQITDGLLGILTPAMTPRQANAALVDIIEIIEGDYLVQRRCPSLLPGGLRCCLPLADGERTHSGAHEALVTGETFGLHGARVEWSNFD